jgi:hypothetical protein
LCFVCLRVNSYCVRRLIFLDKYPVFLFLCVDARYFIVCHLILKASLVGSSRRGSVKQAIVAISGL